MTRAITFLCTLASALSCSQLANADVIFVDEGANDFRIASITDLEIDGVLYNVTFHDVSDWESSPTERTYDDYLANSGVTDPITFNNVTDAAAALNTVKAEIIAAGVDASAAVDSHFFLDIPYAETATTFSRVNTSRSSFNPLAYNSAVFPVTTGRSTANIGDTAAFLEFDVAGVPEPSTWALLTLAGIGFGGYQMRRKKTCNGRTEL